MPLTDDQPVRLDPGPVSMSGRRTGRDMRLRVRAAQAVMRLRGRHLFVLDVVALTIAQYLAQSISHDRFLDLNGLLLCLPCVFVVLGARLTVNVIFGLYSRRWRFASVPDLERIAFAAGTGSIAAAIGWYGLIALASARGLTVTEPQRFVAGSFWPTELLLSGALLGALRFGIRATADRAPRRDGTPIRRTLLFGAGETGALVARWSRRTPDSGIEPVGFLDDDPALSGLVVADVPVFGGLGELDRAIAATGAEALLITMPSAPGSAVRAVLDASLSRGLEVHTVPAMTDIVDGSVEAYRVRDVRVEDLLRRPIVTEHAAGVDRIIRGRVVLITGAAGSIGSELARQVFSLGPRRLILVDRAESPLYLVERELEHRRDQGRAAGELRVRLCSVSSRALVGALIAAERPSVIFHAAAYKHVPMLEEHPTEAAQVNVGGTLALLDAAAVAQVGRFVFVSTDKAVRPTSAMGASKRIAEMLVADYARRTGEAYVSVRFGNVLDSAGSVVPIFRSQLESNEALTITHPDMTRFFMTIPEAAWLILDAAALGRRGGDLFVLDMGEPVRIVDLARDLTRLAGRDPESQPILVTGLRPGEKLHEELSWDGERIERTTSDKVLRLAAPQPPASVRDDVGELLRLADGLHEAQLRSSLVRYATATAGRHPAPLVSSPQTPIAVPGPGERA
jgi:FlaA1/EpsC-like NDP-sugar epimerase